MLFFSTRGIVYKLKVLRLPIGNPQSRGKFIKNLLPLQDGERISSILALPENEESWDELDVVFATRQGQVRRNKLSDFTQVNRNGKIAMKFERRGGRDRWRRDLHRERRFPACVTALGQCIRFQVPEVRVFKGRDSTGVRGISLGDGDEVISLTILRHFDSTPAERDLFPKQWRAITGEEALPDEASIESDEAEEIGGEERAQLSPERYAQMDAHQQFVLTVNEYGYGKRSSSYQFLHEGARRQGQQGDRPVEAR